MEIRMGVWTRKGWHLYGVLVRGLSYLIWGGGL